MVRSRIAFVVALAAYLGCQSGSQDDGQGAIQAQPSPVTGPENPEPSPPATPSDAAVVVIVESDARAKPEEPELPDPGRVIAELGAIPAWQAVVDRAQLLGRRGQRGVVYGRVGPPILVAAPAPPPALPGAGSGSQAVPVAAGSGSQAVPVAAGSGSQAVPVAAGSGSQAAPVAAGSGSQAVPVAAGSGSQVASVAPGPGSQAAPVVAAAGAPIDPRLVPTPYVWLIDDTDGNGSLGIRIALGDKARPGDRIAAGGAWHVDAERRWYWKADTVQALPPAPPSDSDVKDPPPPAPSHAVAAGPLPAGARTISVARDNDAVYFQVVGPPPTSDGDGWQIADQLGSPVIAIVNLPGERASYGGQDMRAADERWQLKRGQTYWIRIGKLRKRAPDKPATVNARTAPIRVQ